MPTSKALKRHSSLKELGPGHPLYPDCDGKPWNNQGADSRSKVISQFVEAYFRINLAYAQLLAFRKKRRAASQTPKSLAIERIILQEIEKAIVFREALEDRYASRGILATPVYRDGMTVDVRFSDFQTGQQQGGPLIISSSSVRITIKLPAGLRSKLCKS
jgi:hypothetical protein